MKYSKIWCVLLMAGLAIHGYSQRNEVIGSLSGTVAVDDRNFLSLHVDYREEGNQVLKTSRFHDGLGSVFFYEEERFFLSPLSIESFTVSDSRSGRHEDCRMTPQGLWFSYRRNFSSQVRTRIIQKEGPVLHGGMIPVYILQNLKGLIHGEILRFDLIVPSRMTTYRFKLKYKKEGTWEGRPAHHIVMVPTSVLLAALVADTHFYFQMEPPHAMLGYIGVIGPEDEMGKTVKAKVVLERMNL